MALTRIAIPSPNYSSRGGARVRLIVLHTAEGARTYQSLGAFFKGNVQASSHVGIDDTPGVIGEYVRRAYKAWTAAYFNPVATQVELCAFAKWDRAEWFRHPNMLNNCARWIAEEAAYFGIPITRLTPAQAQGTGRGVCQHVDLGSRGGGHWDCGPGFPMNDVLEMARSGGTPVTPPKPEPPKENDLIASEVTDSGNFIVLTVGPQRHTVWITNQGAGQSNWSGGEKGKQVAKLRRFADAPKGRTITGITATRGNGGMTWVFVTLDNGAVYAKTQGKGKTDWSDLSPFAPAP